VILLRRKYQEDDGEQQIFVAGSFAETQGGTGLGLGASDQPKRRKAAKQPVF
jgi:hypothetical protein